MSGRGARRGAVQLPGAQGVQPAFERALGGDGEADGAQEAGDAGWRGEEGVP